MWIVNWLAGQIMIGGTPIVQQAVCWSYQCMYVLGIYLLVVSGGGCDNKSKAFFAKVAGLE